MLHYLFILCIFTWTIFAVNTDTIYFVSDLHELPNLLIQGARKIRLQPYFLSSGEELQQYGISRPEFRLLTASGRGTAYSSKLNDLVDSIESISKLLPGETLIIQLEPKTIDGNICSHSEDNGNMWESHFMEFAERANLLLYDNGFQVFYEFVGVYPQDRRGNGCLDKVAALGWPGAWMENQGETMSYLVQTDSAASEISTYQVPYSDFSNAMSRNAQYLVQLPHVRVNIQFFNLESFLEVDTSLFNGYLSQGIRIEFLSFTSPSIANFTNPVSPRHINRERELALPGLSHAVLARYHLSYQEDFYSLLLFSKMQNSDSIGFTNVTVSYESNENVVTVNDQFTKIVALCETEDISAVTSFIMNDKYYFLVACSRGSLHFFTDADRTFSYSVSDYGFSPIIFTGKVTTAYDTYVNLLLAWTNSTHHTQVVHALWSPEMGLTFQASQPFITKLPESHEQIHDIHMDVSLHGACDFVFASSPRRHKSFGVLAWSIGDNHLYSATFCFNSTHVSNFLVKRLGYGGNVSVSLTKIHVKETNSLQPYILVTHDNAPVWRSESRLSGAKPLCEQSFETRSSDYLGYYASTVRQWVLASLANPDEIVAPCNQTRFSVGNFDRGSNPTSVLYTTQQGELNAVVFQYNQSLGGLVRARFHVPIVSEETHVEIEAQTDSSHKGVEKMIVAYGITLISILFTIYSTVFWFLTRRALIAQRESRQITVSSLFFLELLQAQAASQQSQRRERNEARTDAEAYQRIQ